ncbi:MAG: alpha-L-fucosidase [Verrucomicrobia bacterium]|nr:alpha-L-fucosidase [Verrucomicrobiota bacterium]
MQSAIPLTPDKPIAQWFRDAKLGIFIHWGIYAVKGVAESWSFFRGDISHQEYMSQCAGFTASKYDPAAWAQLFKEANADYAVLTAKHHDGVALWPTAHSHLNVVQQTPAKRDLLGPWVDAMRANGIRVGIYFSHLDWNHPDYPSLLPDNYDPSVHNNPFAYPKDGVAKPEQWNSFLRFHRAQLEELSKRYRPDLFWFDGSWEPAHKHWKFAELDQLLRTWCPGVVLNSRMGGYGDYETPEQGMPTTPPKGNWEFCMTLNDSWGYQPKDKNYKSIRQLVRMFAEIIGMGGRLLLDIGPRADGTIPGVQKRLLRQLGDWIRLHQEAVYQTGAGLPPGLFYGASTLSSDKRCLYLFLFDRPWKEIAVKGILSGIKRVSLVNGDQTLSHRIIGGAPWMNVPGVLWIDVPAKSLHPLATVVKIELEQPLQLWLAEGQVITAN